MEGILTSLKNKNVCSYVNYNTDFTKNIPQHLQRLMIEKFCKQKNFKISTELLEYNNMKHLPILFYALENKKFKIIVIFSIQSVNINKRLVKKIINYTKKFNKKIYFANENIQLESTKTKKLIKNLL